MVREISDGGRVDRSRCALDGHRLGDAAERQGGVHAGRVVDVQDDAAAARRLESREADLHDIAADGQELETIGADIVGRHGAGETGVDVASRDGGAGQRCAARVRDGADNRGAGDLGAGD